jgi:hypothetical protein
MTDQTLAAVDALRGDITHRFDDLGRRIDSMVTRREHDAEVRRIDAYNQATRAAVDQNKSDADGKIEALQTAVADGDAKVAAELEADRQQRAAEIKQAAADRKADRRWMIGSVLAAAGLAVPVAAFVRDLIGP